MSLQRAELHEKAEMHTEFVEEMRKIVQESQEEAGKMERKMLSNAYKNVISKLRDSWRSVNAIEEKLPKGDSKQALVAKYLVIIGQELTLKCEELLALLEEDLIPKLTQPKAKVFFHKMKGDHLRHLLEIADPEDPKLEDLKWKSKSAYSEATRLSEKHFEAIDPFRLGLALNFSVFFYEVENSQERAYETAKTAFDEAMPLMVQLDEDEADDVTTIMQLLRDNLTFWGEDA